MIGDPTEGALLALAAKGVDGFERLVEKCPRVAEIPFDSGHKFHATFHRDGDVYRLYAKGAPDVLLARASQHLTAAGQMALDEVGRSHWRAENEYMAGKAMRVLAMADKVIPADGFDPDGDLMAHVQNLTLLGLAGISDPPRPEARQAIALCHQAGIKVKMITGDHRITAAATAQELGIEGEVIDGSELDELSPEELARRIDNIGVFARVAPEHKVRIVRAFKARGEVVAMTGDGVNDAPALKKADIGVAMGITGTDVAKEAADMVLLDDNFATIVAAVEEGRTIYDNIRKFIKYTLTSNAGELWVMLTAPFLGMPLALLPLQILWINLVTDGLPGLALTLSLIHI